MAGMYCKIETRYEYCSDVRSRPDTGTAGMEDETKSNLQQRVVLFALNYCSEQITMPNSHCTDCCTIL